MKKHGLHLLIAVLSIVAPSALAQPAVGFSGELVSGGGFNGPDQVQGWDFTTREAVTITHLGMYDGRPYESVGFLEPHAVGIWTLDGTLLTSAPIPAGTVAPYSDGFRYVQIQPITLAANRTYVTAVFLPAPVIDYTVLWTTPGPSFLTMDPRILFGNYRAGLGPMLVYPTSSWSGYIGGFGPNFIMLPASTSNRPPVALVEVRPTLPHLPVDAIVAGDNAGAMVELDGTGSSDPDGDHLQFVWSRDGSVIGNGPVISSEFSLGTHTVSLRVSDVRTSDSITTTFAVVTPAEAVELLAAFLHERLGRVPRPLQHALDAAQDAFETGNEDLGLQRLRVFTHKVRAQIQGADPDAAAAVVEITEAIIAAVVAR